MVPTQQPHLDDVEQTVERGAQHGQRDDAAHMSRIEKDRCDWTMWKPSPWWRQPSRTRPIMITLIANAIRIPAKIFGDALGRTTQISLRTHPTSNARQVSS
jgi:hypothetical protein